MGFTDARLWLLAGTALAGAMIANPALAQAVADKDAAKPAEGGVDEIVVTATKTSLNLQDVPMSIQALGEVKLAQLQVRAFNDYVKFLPSVSYQTNGPGSARVYFRGVSTGENANHSTSQPTVGIYVDEMPVTTITGSIDLHVYDMARVEALAGPQGTLYGAASEAGTIRMITNKPDPTKFAARMDVEGNHIDSGGTGGVIQGMVNVPVNEKMALRVVGWWDKAAGYIDNIFNRRTFPSSGITVDNARYVKKNYNTVDTLGGRAALGIELDDDWTITPAIQAQRQRINGFFGQQSTLGRRQVSHYFPENAKDDWYQASLTVEGKIGKWDLTYAGGYMYRSTPADSDYSDYSYFYDALYGSGAYITDNNGNLINPSQRILSRGKFNRQSHELRITSPQTERLRMIAGLFYQRQVHNIEENYVIDGLADSLKVPGTVADIWLTKQQRVDRDYAAFAEVSYDITEKFTVTGGARLYRYDNTLVGFFGYGAGFSSSTGEARCFAGPIVPGTPCTNLNAQTAKTDVLFKANATWKVTDDHMIYATFSQGFRPGGINRRSGLNPYRPDTLDNFELGFKTSWLDNALRVNGAIYQQNWRDIQFSFLGANGLTLVQNAGNARIRGVEFDIQVAPTRGLTLSAGGSYNDAKLVKPFIDGGGSVLAAVGTRLPTTPRFKGNMLARYEFDVGKDKTAWLQGAYVYEGSRLGDLRSGIRAITGDFPAYATLDLSAGIKNDQWSAELYVTNLFDSGGITQRSVQCGETVCGDPGGVTATGGIFYNYIIRPRTFGIKLGHSF